MQNRYVGDVGDFGKYALLRRLVGRAEEQRVRLGVVWCLFPDENHNADGRHTSYIERANFVGLDEDLRSSLRQLVSSGERTVHAVADSGLLPSNTVFYDQIIALTEAGANTAARLAHRQAWLERCQELTKDCDLVFFDPDNGLEIASVPRSRPKAGKFIFWRELVPFWERQQALLVYHHLNRTKSAAEQVSELRLRVLREFHGSTVTSLVFRRGSLRVFWLVCPRGSAGEELSRRAAEFGVGDWSRHFQLDQSS